MEVDRCIHKKALPISPEDEGACFDLLGMDDHRQEEPVDQQHQE